MKKTLALLLSILMLSMMAVPAMAADAACPECEKNTFIYYMTVAPTCTEDGYKLWKCNNGECGYEVKTEITEKLGHAYPAVELYEHVDGGCTKDSFDHAFCARCGREDKINVVAAPDHKWVTVERLPANCTEAERDLKKCTNCGEEKTVIVSGGDPYTYHKMTIVVSAPETCKDEAVIVYKCEKCDYQSSVSTTPVDHVDENADGVCDVCESQIVLEEEPHGFYAQIIKWISELVDAFKAFLAAIKGDSIF